METVVPVALSWVRALARQDFDALKAALDPAVQFRALVPGERTIARGAEETVACFRRWFSDKTDIEIVDEHASVLVDRVSVRFRARVRKNGRPYLIEQSLWGDLENGRFATLDVLCSGFRPEPVAAGGSTATGV